MNKGYIVISKHLYENNYDLISIIFTKFRPTHIEKTYWTNDGWTIWGESKEFREVKEGEEVPRYDVVLKSGKKKIESFYFSEILF